MGCSAKQNDWVDQLAETYPGQSQHYIWKHLNSEGSEYQLSFAYIYGPKKTLNTLKCPFS